MNTFLQSHESTQNNSFTNVLFLGLYIFFPLLHVEELNEIINYACCWPKPGKADKKKLTLFIHTQLQFTHTHTLSRLVPDIINHEIKECPNQLTAVGEPQCYSVVTPHSLTFQKRARQIRTHLHTHTHTKKKCDHRYLGLYAHYQMY